ncbi:MAG TPA: replicative DNA helicase [Nevskiales bacterium]|nr:replicative DNA helicase [Nevskiales bacterium]
MTIAKLPPHSIEAEQAVLGGLLLDNEAWLRIAGRVAEEDFYREDHRLIFRAIQHQAENNKPYDAVTLAEWLRSRGQLEEAGGLAYLGTLANETPSSANIVAYGDIVREQSVLRQLIGAGVSISEMGYAPQGRSTSELLNEAEKKVFAIAEQIKRGKQDFQSVGDVLPQVVSRIHELYESDQPLTGLSTGLTKFDEMTSGLQKGDLIIVAARPAMGKTSLAMNIVENVAIKHNVPTAIFSMEMSSTQLLLRMIASLGRIDQQHVRTGKLEDSEWPRFTSAVSLIEQARNCIFVDDSSTLSPTELHARARRMQRDHRIGLVVIDYLQLMTVPGTRENRTTEVSEISRSLKALARDLNVPVIALSQVSRKAETNPDNKPKMSDLRESGSIEQDADMVVFIHREEYYKPDSPKKGTAEIIIGKQRNGPTDSFEVAFLRHCTRFENLAADYYEEVRG